MRTKFYFVAALAATMLASCADEQFVGENSPNVVQNESTENAINFAFNMQNITRADELTGATAADKLGGMFVVEGTKGSEQTNSPSLDVVFDNYLVGYEANTAGKTESNTHNWEYVGKQSGITTPLRMSDATWTALHPSGTSAQAQTIKYWDYSAAQYDFIAWSTGKLQAVDGAPTSGTSIQVTRINKGNTLATNGFTLTAASANDLLQCYYTDITTVKKGTDGENYNKPVTLKFKSLAAKVRVALYETVPGYSVKDVYFYTSDESPATPGDLGYATTNTLVNATLFTMGSDALPTKGAVTVCYPHIGTGNENMDDYNKASVKVVPSGDTKTQAFGALTAQYRAAVDNEPSGDKFLGMTLPTATFAGDKTKGFYTAVVPNPDGKALTLRVDYTLVSTDGSGEVIKVYGAKAVVPSTYTEWQPNYAYTYIFKISDNSNGWTSKTYTDPKGLFPITFDAVVASFTDVNAEQTTVTTVASPSITTYQQGHKYADQDEYSNKQIAGKSSAVKSLYVQVMNNSNATPSLIGTLSNTNSLLFSVNKTNASEAEVMDALLNRTNAYNAANPNGRNGVNLTANDNISNTIDYIVNGADDNPIDLRNNKVDNSGHGKAAEIDIKNLAEGTYAYVYYITPPTSDVVIYHVAAATNENFTSYYKVALGNDASTIVSGTAAANHVYFIKNLKADDSFDSYTFKPTKAGDNVAGLVDGGEFPTDKATGTFDPNAFYFDVYNKNNGEYAVKVFKVKD